MDLQELAATGSSARSGGGSQGSSPHQQGRPNSSRSADLTSPLSEYEFFEAADLLRTAADNHGSPGLESSGSEGNDGQVRSAPVPREAAVGGAAPESYSDETLRMIEADIAIATSALTRRMKARAGESIPNLRLFLV
jgi:hypothetical protein